MKTTPYIVTFFVSIALISCNKPKPNVVPGPAATPQPTPEIAPTLEPSPIPSPTPEPTPQARLAPEGTFYVIKSFKVTTEDGIIGFPKGKKVTLIREEGDQYIVTDGKVEGKSSRDSFTKDLDIADNVLAEVNSKLQTIQQSHRSWKQAAAAQAASKQEELEKHLEHEKNAQRTKEIAILKNRREALSLRISVARSERKSKGFPSDGGSRTYNHDSRTYYYNNGYSYSYRSRTTVKSLGTDATEIETLLKQHAQLEAQLRQLGAL